MRCFLLAGLMLGTIGAVGCQPPNTCQGPAPECGANSIPICDHLQSGEYRWECSAPVLRATGDEPVSAENLALVTSGVLPAFVRTVAASVFTASTTDEVALAAQRVQQVCDSAPSFCARLLDAGRLSESARAEMQRLGL